ncbi:MAG: iron-sulfur cluster assembly accessory protein [Cycloclasticus sp.]|nr:iron-sulfur cluster assembly accessory protein [Cycloclasticus sp.]MBG95330.1 iron-sulfur cluster assembly accessory protein [Cycloclasticus sp.]HAI97883.1 iron-sulfur cluster assembly accessory protein [Methylococcaceae bacterium]|tara:strand:- start:421 stop:810 length:390 start_codon:yes stop_codon:yes gene_type:complete
MGAAQSFTTELTSSDINISTAASAKLAELFVEVGDEMEAIRIFVSGGGCSGMSYGMTFSDDRTAYDSVLDTGEYKIYVDAVALNYMRGVEIDFVDKGMGEASFVFNNVFAATGGSGGCGSCGSASGGCG